MVYSIELWCSIGVLNRSTYIAELLSVGITIYLPLTKMHSFLYIYVHIYCTLYIHYFDNDGLFFVFVSFVTFLTTTHHRTARADE